MSGQTVIHADRDLVVTMTAGVGRVIVTIMRESQHSAFEMSASFAHEIARQLNASAIVAEGNRAAEEQHEKFFEEDL